jgi:formylglycine-generating enzyme required for sulfatase activity/DNA-binding SARP family transcriptional activator
MNTVQLLLLGPPMASRHGQRIRLDRKALALLAHLAVTDERVSRATLADLLWPESAQAGANLRKCLWSIAHLLGEGCVAVDPANGTVRLGPDLISDRADGSADIDVLQLDRHLAACRSHGHPADAVCTSCITPLTEAAALFRGEFLAGFTLRDSADFDDWQALHSQRLYLIRMSVLDRLAGAHAARREFRAALGYAEQRLALDPVDEAAHRQMMQVLAWSGQRVAAIRQFDDCQQRLDGELGVAPDPETVEIRRAIEANRLPPPADLADAVVAAAPRPTDESLPHPSTDRPVQIAPAYVFTGSHPSVQHHPVDRIRVTESTALVQVAPRIDVGGSTPVRPAHGVGASTPPVSKVAIQSAVQELQRVVLDAGAEVALPADLVAAAARHSPLDLAAYHLGRIAAWSLPRYRLNQRFVALSLLVDQGEVATERWRVEPTRFTDLAAVQAATGAPALVLLGRPGAGKSTLLRHLELDSAITSLRTGDRRVTFYASLNAYRPEEPGAAPPSPMSWLCLLWQERFPQLPALRQLLAEGRMLLLLDGLNEMPHRDAADYRALVDSWKACLHQVVGHRSPDSTMIGDPPGNQVIFACRSLDYSAPLSTPGLPVPQVRIEALSDAQIHAFVACYSPDHADAILTRLAAAPLQAELFRTPYALRLLVEQAEAEGAAAWDWAGLCTAMIRRALLHEIERGNPLLAAAGSDRWNAKGAESRAPGRSDPPALLTERDRRRVIQVSDWPDPYGLPAQGRLFGKLADLAFGMQAGGTGGEAAQVRLGYSQASTLLADPEPEAILEAGVTLGILEDDLAHDEVLFVHQLVQEYFAARRLAIDPDVGLARVAWRRDAVAVGVAEALAALPPSEALPDLPSTGWEETTVLAATLTADPDAFVLALADTHLPLAARCAQEIGVRCRLATATVATLRHALVQRSADPAADLRARITAGLALGQLGDPRLTQGRGPYGDYRIGPLVAIPPGDYPIGDDDPVPYLGRDVDRHVPRHVLHLGGFRIGRFGVTNAEFACFVAAGGYADTRWWDSAAGRAWQRGEGTAEGHRAAVRYWWQWFKQDPVLVEQQYARGEFTAEKVALWRRRIAMDADALEEHLREIHPDARCTEPLYWHDEAFNNPAQPVVGISWFEACAYCAWLAAQTGLAVRLPSEVEWEAAARGVEGRRYPPGEDWDPAFGNLVDLRIRRTTPVGVFPEGESPEGIADLCGNTWDWTGSLAGPDMRAPRFRYPYDPADGREDPEAPMTFHRVVRGGAWVNGRVTARADYRGFEHPCDRTNLHGLRIVVGDADDDR